MRHRLQQSGLQCIALTGDLGGLRFGRKSILAECLPHLVGSGCEQSGLGSVRFTTSSGPRGDDRAKCVLAGFDPNPIRLKSRRWPWPGRRRPMNPQPSSRRIARCPLQDPLKSGIGPRRLPAVGRDSLARVVRTKADPDSIHLGLFLEDPDDRRQDRGRGGPRRESATDLKQGACLTLSYLGDLGAVALECGESADDDPDEEQQEEVDEFPWVIDNERVARVDEEEVVEDEGGDGRQHCTPGTRHNGRRDDRDQIQRGWVGYAEAVLEDRDRERCRSQGRARHGNESSELAAVDLAHVEIVGVHSR